MEKTLNIVSVSDSSETDLYIERLLRSGVDHILGADMIVIDGAGSKTPYNSPGGRSTPRTNDFVVCNVNLHDHDVYNGDLGLVVDGPNGPVVEIGEKKVPLTAEFSIATALSFHKVQGMSFRNVVAVAAARRTSERDLDRYLAVVADAAKDTLTVVGTRDDLEKILGPIGPDAVPELDELGRRLQGCWPATWSVQIDGRPVATVDTYPSAGPRFR
jgi:hypothetical protein